MNGLHRRHIVMREIFKPVAIEKKSIIFRGVAGMFA